MIGLDFIQRSEGFKASTILKIVNGIYNQVFHEKAHPKIEDIAKLTVKEVSREY
jgi:hypothetical protein